MTDLLKFTIVGHKDHGKSTLMGRLLYDSESLPKGTIEEISKTCELLGKKIEFSFIFDSLQEEREESITIDTTQRFFKTGKRNYVIIDAPGHKEFLRNMITGASQADAGVLIVSAKDGVQEQTKRHAFILSLLGIEQLVAVVNIWDDQKDPEKTFIKVKKDLLSFLKKLNLKPNFVIPIVATQGDNIVKKSTFLDWYDDITVIDALDSFNVQEIVKNNLRMPVQIVHNNLVMGRVEGGRICKGDEVIILPSGSKAVVKSVQCFNQNRSEAGAGESIGLTLTKNVRRGDVICHFDNKPQVSKKIESTLFWISDKPVNVGDGLTIKCATQELDCRITKIKERIDSSSLKVLEKNAKKLKTNDVGHLVLKTNKPLVFDDFNTTPELGRFVLVRDKTVVAGGIIA